MTAPVAASISKAEPATGPDERLAEHIRRIVDRAPILTAEQRDRLAVLLRGAVDPR